MSLPVDHLVLAAPELDDGVELVAGLTGVRPLAGGSHPGLGTRNALMGLGGGTYLEIIGPDPEQPEPEAPRPFMVDVIDEPRLVTYACRAGDLDAAVAAARAAGVNLGEPRAMSRTRPDGGVLRWRLTPPDMLLYDGLLPFLIDWGDTESPAVTAQGGCRLVELRAAHPRPDAVRAALATLGVTLDVQEAGVPALTATLETPNGPVDLR